MMSFPISTETLPFGIQFKNNARLNAMLITVFFYIDVLSNTAPSHPDSNSYFCLILPLRIQIQIHTEVELVPDSSHNNLSELT